MNKARKQQKSFAIFSYLNEKVTSSSNSSSSSSASILLLRETYTLLSSLVQESNVRDGVFMQSAVRERAYSKGYADMEGGTAKVDLNRKIQLGGRVWLEQG